MMKSEHHQLVEEIADEILKYYVTHLPFGYTNRENQIKQTLSPFARKIKEQQKEIERLEKQLENGVFYDVDIAPPKSKRTFGI